PVDARATQHRTRQAIRLRQLRRDRTHADGPLEEDLVLVEDRDVVVLDVLGVTIEEARELSDPARREVIEHAARPVVVEVHARAAELLEHVEDLLAIAEAPEDGRRRADVESVRTEPHEVRGATAHLVDDDADELGAAGNVDIADRFHRARVRVLVEHVRDVVGLVRVADPAVVGAPLEDLFDAAVQVPHDRDALDDLFAGELEDQAQHAVGRWMLRPHVEDELLDLALFGLDRRERVAGGFRDLATLRVGGGYGLSTFGYLAQSLGYASRHAQDWSSELLANESLVAHANHPWRSSRGAGEGLRGALRGAAGSPPHTHRPARSCRHPGASRSCPRTRRPTTRSCPWR